MLEMFQPHGIMDVPQFERNMFLWCLLYPNKRETIPVMSVYSVQWSICHSLFFHKWRLVPSGFLSHPIFDSRPLHTLGFDADAKNRQLHSYGYGWSRLSSTTTQWWHCKPRATIRANCCSMCSRAAISWKASLPRFPVPIMERTDPFVDFDGGPPFSWAASSDQFSARFAKGEPSTVLYYGRPVPAVCTAHTLGYPKPCWTYRLVPWEVR